MTPACRQGWIVRLAELEGRKLRKVVPVVRSVARAVSERAVTLVRAGRLDVALAVEQRDQDDLAGVLVVDRVLNALAIHVAGPGDVLPRWQVDRGVIRNVDRGDQLGRSAGGRGPVQPTDVARIALAKRDDVELVHDPGHPAY